MKTLNLTCNLNVKNYLLVIKVMPLFILSNGEVNTIQLNNFINVIKNDNISVDGIHLVSDFNAYCNNCGKTVEDYNYVIQHIMNTLTLRLEELGNIIMYVRSSISSNRKRLPFDKPIYGYQSIIYRPYFSNIFVCSLLPQDDEFADTYGFINILRI